MHINYSDSNLQPSFGCFIFCDGAKDILKKKIKTSADLKKFQKLCIAEQTGDRGCRAILVHASFKNGSYSGSRLVAGFEGKWNKQGIFQSPLAFLEKIINKADVLQKKNGFSKAKTQIVDSLA